MVAKTIVDTLTCVEDGAPVKKESDTNASVDGYTVVDRLNKVKAEALDYTQPSTISQVQAKSVTDA